MMEWIATHIVNVTPMSGGFSVHLSYLGLLLIAMPFIFRAWRMVARR